MMSFSKASAVAVSGLLASALADTCQVGEGDRRDCKKMSMGECHQAGCCWQPVDPNPSNVPWCFYGSSGPSPAPPPPPAQCGKIDVDERVDCGKGDGECEAAGCCWNPVDPNPDNIPWCYYSDRKLKACSLAAAPKVPFSAQERAAVRQYFEANLDIQGSGMVVAAPDRNTGMGGSYYYAWMRDGALSMNALQLTAEKFSDIEQKMDSWLSWVERSQNQPDPNGVDIRVEPKFEIPSGKPYTGGWCRPQNDGPGLRAITLMELVKNKPSVADRAWNVAKDDLDWVAANYTMVGCDLWEEVRSTDFFWGRFTMRKALLQGSDFAKNVGKDTDRAAKYAAVAQDITSKLQEHVNSEGFVCEASNRCKDTASIEAFNVGYMGDDVFAPLDKEVVATLSGLSKVFCRSFGLNVNAANAGVPGVLFGRYEGDTYAGGNPWILLTASAANLLYSQAEAFAKGTKPSQEANAILEELLGGQVSATALLGAGDAIMLLMKNYLSNGMHMNEQIDRDSGELKSAKDLTWNYANVLKAMKQRDAASATMEANEVIV